MMEGNFIDGKEDGKWTRWYENGQIESEGNYKDGKKDGKWTWWHENGQKWSETNYKDGKQEGQEDCTDGIFHGFYPVSEWGLIYLEQMMVPCDHLARDE